jgi:Icc-related predicted phosphoesterase
LTGKRFTRVFYATDVHGSERCFRKFLSAVKVYKADVLVLGGDITGKIVIPIRELSNGAYRATYLGKDQVASTPEELNRLKELIADSGYYYYMISDSQGDLSKEEIDKVFLKAMKETLARWIDYAEKVLRDTDTVCYVTGGNDDFQEVVDGIPETEHVKNPDNKVIKIDSSHEMASLGWSNVTPWRCPRECSEEELNSRIEKICASVSDPSNCVFNFHCPPVDCGLDTAVKLDDSVYPPKPIMNAGEPVRFGAGSSSVRSAIELHQPLVDLCGHIHESRGVCKIKKTLVINPGSEYTEGILNGVLVNLSDKKVLSWQLTSA